MPDPEPSKPATKRAADQAERFRDAMEKIRTRTDLAAKGLATVGTAAITALGYAKLADVFPYGGPAIALVGLFAGAAAMVVAVVVGVFRFHGASRSVVTVADTAETIKLNRFSIDEQLRVADTYEAMGKLNGVDSLAAYQARAHRFERIAARTSDATVANALRERADLIAKEILATQDRVGALILRERANQAVFGAGTLACIAIFVAGWYTTSLSADALESRRAGEIEVAKSCAETRALKETVESKVPGICGKVSEEEQEERQKEEEAEAETAAETAAGAVSALATARAECLAAAAKAEEDGADCAPLSRALAAALGEGSSK